MFGLKNSEIGIAMMQAHDVAGELGHLEVGPDHMLLGLTTNLRGSVQQVLAEHGLTYTAARDTVAGHHASHASNVDNDSAAAAGPDGASLDDDREALASIGIDLDKVSEAVGSAFGEDITRAGGRRRERGTRGNGAQSDGGSDEDQYDADRGPGARGHRGPGYHGSRRGPGSGGPRGRGPEMPPPPPAPEFPDFPDSEWSMPFGGPRGRGRRGPQSRRFGRGPRFSTAAVQILHDLRSEARDARGALQEDGDRAAGREQFHATFRPERIVLAILDSADPATRALVSSMTDVPGLRTILRERLAPSTAA